jgi:hypothetical protein
MQIDDRYYDRFPHPSVDMHAQNFQIGAAIRFTVSTGNALATVQIRFDSTMVTDAYSLAVRPDVKHFHTQLVTENSGIGKKRLSAAVGVQVRPADTNPRYTHQRLARTNR